MPRFTILACGSRGWSDKERIRTQLVQLAGRDKVTLIHGGARGADRLAGEVASEEDWTVEEFPADWETHGKRAGFIRNVEMLEQEPDFVVAFWDGNSRGTEHTIREAVKRDIPVQVVFP